MITKRVETVLVQHYGHKELERRRVISEILRRFDGWQKVADLPAGTAAMAENVKRAPSQNTSRTNSPRFPPVLLGGNMICSHPRSGREGSALGNEHAFPAPFMVLPQRIELWTSPLPRGCSTTELRQRVLNRNAGANAAMLAIWGKSRQARRPRAHHARVHCSRGASQGCRRERGCRKQGKGQPRAALECGPAGKSQAPQGAGQGSLARHADLGCRSGPRFCRNSRER
jgi:hypothetical protein